MVNFDELSEKAFAEDGTVEDKNELWGNVFLLKEWYFIARGEAPNLHPYIASNKNVANGQPMIRAFTDTDRLYDFARENELLDEGGNAPALTIPTDKAIEFLAQFEEEVFGIWFNSDPQSIGFYAPLKQMAAIKSYVDENWTPNGPTDTQEETPL
jgi:hypothetical protein